ncbi:MAG: DUF4290 domain-containing protein [Pseudoflavonifractor sp.]|nr:DUF4290 domain-containing protein [Alloprevotella sp.]MCM1116266.1 DUF4290 domain-containing protein [Pseudoflavonifractor sp.]
MLSYNTRRAPLKLPEYGRNIQQMVDHCLTVANRDERTRCAYTIVEVMKTLLPQTGDPDEYMRKLWDHLAIMSDFKLDIDYPFEVIAPDNLFTRPDNIKTRPNYIRYRHYGKGVEKLIEAANAMEEGEEREALVMMIANQMKKMLLAINPDGIDDRRVFDDLAEMSHGNIVLDPETTLLHEFTIVEAPAPGKKKRKRKK